MGVWQFKNSCFGVKCRLQGVAVPVFFTAYPHKGILSEKKRIQFIKKCLLFDELKDKILMADREFIGQQWFSFLEKQSIYFIIRLRKGNYAKAISESKSYENLQKQARKKGYAHTKFSLQQSRYRIENSYCLIVNMTSD